MLNKLATKLALRLLKNRRLSAMERLEITNALLDKVGALPIRDVISFDREGTVYVSGKALTIEQAVTLKASADTLKASTARRLIHDQILYEALKIGVHEGLTPEMIMFSKAAIWCIQNEEKILSQLIPHIPLDA